MCAALRRLHSASGEHAFEALQASVRPLAQAIPCRGEDVHVLSSPAEFLHELHAGISAARQRVVLSSLYFGVEGRAEKGVLSALAAALRARPELQVDVLLDARRGTRPVSDGCGGRTSSASELAAMLLSVPGGRASVRLHATPSLSAGVLPPRLRELTGVLHVKAAVFDDTALWTGANIAETYLTRRQDRYLRFAAQPRLADATCSLVAALVHCSARLAPDGTLTPPEGVHRVTHAHGRQLASALSSVLQPAPTRSHAAAADADSLAFLTVQAGYCGLRHDEHVTAALLTTTASLGGVLNLSTPYLNPPHTTERLLAMQPRLSMLTASPQCHGWAGASGAASYVPAAYAVMEHRTLRRLTAMRGDAQTLRMLEYERMGWEFHAKGLWWSPEEGEPMASVVGSSNYGLRSMRRDLEANLVLLTRHEGLRSALGAEWRALSEHASEVSAHQLANRRPGFTARLAAHAARRWM
jgi:CDP-diacylglycerol--glycerol-3-phosphate 3-phosphatidyltransferase